MSQLIPSLAFAGNAEEVLAFYKAGTPGDNFSLSVALDNEAQAAEIFAALATGGKVTMPFETTFFAKKFGMLKDRFGIGWMVNVPATVPA